MRKLSFLLASALSLSGLNVASVSAFEPSAVAKVFAKLAKSPELKNPSIELVDVSSGEVVFQSNAF